MLGAGKPGAEADPSVDLQHVIRVFRRQLHFPDPGPIELYLASIAANRLAGDPVWVLFVGGPSTGKTEIILSGRGLRGVRLASALTEPGLLSGTPRREKAENARGGLLKEVGSFGILLAKDFNSVLAMHRDARARLLAALREVYDGQWTRHLGTDGGQELTWSGKVGLIAGCTPNIDSHHAVTAAMGERFIFYRMPPVDEEQQSLRAIDGAGHELEMRRELAKAVCGFLDGGSFPSEAPTLSEREKEGLVAGACLAARCRSSVERDPYSRQIELIPEAEAPARLARILRQLYEGMRVIGLERREAWRLLQKISLDCVPAIRRRVFETLQAAGEAVTPAEEVANRIGYPVQTTRRVLEDLTAHGVLDVRTGLHQRKFWLLSDWSWNQFVTLETTIPDLSGGQ